MVCGIWIVAVDLVVFGENGFISKTKSSHCLPMYLGGGETQPTYSVKTGFWSIWLVIQNSEKVSAGHFCDGLFYRKVASIEEWETEELSYS